MKVSTLFCIVVMTTMTNPAISDVYINGSITREGSIRNELDSRCLETCRQSLECRNEMSVGFHNQQRYNNNTWTSQNRMFRMRASEGECSFDSCKGTYDCTFSMDNFDHVFSLYVSGDQNDVCSVIEPHVLAHNYPLKQVLFYTNQPGMDRFARCGETEFSLTCTTRIEWLRLYVVKYACS